MDRGYSYGQMGALIMEIFMRIIFTGKGSIGKKKKGEEEEAKRDV